MFFASVSRQTVVKHGRNLAVASVFEKLVRTRLTARTLPEEELNVAAG